MITIDYQYITQSGVYTVSNSDGSLTISPTSGQVIASVSPTATSATFYPLNPAGTASATFVMMGMGSVITITPILTGIVRLILDGNVNGAASDTGNWKIAYGTGVAPINGVGPTGTVIGATLQIAVATKIAWSKCVIITGLTVNTPVWFDLQADISGGGTLTLSNITATVEELRY